MTDNESNPNAEFRIPKEKEENPKFEFRSPKKIRTSNPESKLEQKSSSSSLALPKLRAKAGPSSSIRFCRAQAGNFGFRASDFFPTSQFELRIFHYD